ncbi:MAG: hypothetical protein AB7W37_09360 [Syntrophobacteraceae bacterium]
MNIKKALTSAVIGLGAVAISGAASAATYNINLYGASAEYLYWNDAADNFLASKGCTNVAQASYDSKNGITKGACGSDTVYIRYTSKASYDGIYAVKNQWDPNETDHQCTSASQRKLVDETSCTWGGSCTALKCQDVTLGASDVAGESFVQSSYGYLLGHIGGAWTERNFSGIDTSSLVNYQPLVVPFAFYVNKAVTRNSAVLTNVPRIMAVLIYSGQVYSWSDFGSEFADKAIVRCLRHAGSGTHATLDLAVMNKAWGGALVQEDLDGQTFFNDGSSDMMKCIDQNGGFSSADAGAIGYADADQSLTSYTNVAQTKYNGEAATKYNIVNGLYDFWSAQWLFAQSGEVNTWVTALTTYASKAANVPSTKAAYWAAAEEMTVEKTPADANYPSTK